MPVKPFSSQIDDDANALPTSSPCFSFFSAVPTLASRRHPWKLTAVYPLHTSPMIDPAILYLPAYLPTK